MKAALIASVVLLCCGAADAQTPAQPAAPQRPAQPAPPQRPAQPAQPAAAAPANPFVVPAPPPPAVNVRVDIVIIDEGGPEARREAVTMTAGVEREGSIRTDGVGRNILNADATPSIVGVPAGRIVLRVTLDYWPSFVGENGESRGTTRTRLSSTLLLDDGRMAVVSDNTDTASNRRVRVEVTATILK